MRMCDTKNTTPGNITSSDKRSADLREKLNEKRFNKTIKIWSTFAEKLIQRKNEYVKK